jgi:protein-tyrosine phosphatase
MFLISLLLGATAILHTDSNPFLLWTAFSFAAIAWGYAGLGVRIFGKRPDGSLHWLPKALLFPFLAYTWAIWHFSRLLSREPAVTLVNPDLTIGRRLLPSEVPEDFDHYVDLTAEFPEPRAIRSLPGYRSFPILDAAIPPAAELSRIARQLVKGKVYIHCAQGHGRTGLFALALLFHRGLIRTPEEGLILLQKLRPGLRLNRAQLHFIGAYMRSAPPLMPLN